MQGEVRAGRRAGREGGGGASGMHGEGPTQGWGPQRARAERTSNMPRMFVTLDVSKASGWLNADAPCRVKRRAYDAGRGAGRGGVRAWRRKRHAHGEGPTEGWGPGHARSAPQRLVERRRALPSRNWAACGARCGPGQAGGRGAGAAQAACTGRVRLKAGAQGTRGAHLEHLQHVRDAGRVEAQRLVECRLALPSQKEYNWEGPTKRLWWLRA
eukprot:scaffold34414_cov60-Phaeocystis_antarctica.AAC.3